MVTRRTFTLAGTGALIGTSLGLQSAVSAEKGQFPVTKTPDEWRSILSPEQFYVLRKHGTERAFSSPLDKNYASGTYNCAGCGTALFKSETKFDSGTGWPSFWQPIEGAVGTTVDKSFFMTRTEVHCANCGGHLGHVFPDGPQPTGQRYCMNGVSLAFVPSGQPEKSES
ncbi:MAG: peptide-methionine (R)-S-oxide reductase MsrB [Pseudomonadota bacterium]